MMVNWTPPATSRWPFGLGVVSSIRADGTVLLALERDIDLGSGATGGIAMVAEADGPVHQAIMWTLPPRCSTIVHSIEDDRVAYAVFENNSEYGGGFFGGAVSDLLPTSALRLGDKSSHTYAAGIPGIVDDVTMTLYGWTPKPSSIANLRWPGDRGLLDNRVAISGESVFWEATTLADQEEQIWTADAGSARLIGFGSDASQGAADLGTDGHDMVWLYGSGRTDPSANFPQVSIMTAPFATTAAALQGRRLRSELPAGFGVEPFKVGCGFAARSLYNGIRVVRLSDGVSWWLAGDNTLPWQWNAPVALTCTELFAKVTVVHGGTGTSGYARVRLDSLGAGTPPDLSSESTADGQSDCRISALLRS